MKTSTLQLRKLSILFIFLLGSLGSSLAQSPLTFVSLTPLTYNGGVNIRCAGQSNGRATMTVTGGVAPYTYVWNVAGNNIVGGPFYGAMPAGPYSVTVTDATGASVTASGVMVENPPVQTLATWTPIQCFGGSSTVTVTAAAGTAPYTGTTTFTVFPGTYIYTVSDANGCRDRDTVTIGQPAILEASATPTAIQCFGETSQVTVAAAGGVLPYTGVGVYTEVAGTYTYTVTDANGCSDDVILGINEPGKLTAGISNTPIQCNGGTSQVTVTVSSGTEPYTGTGIFTEYAGYYTYTVYDFNGCADTIGIAITEPTVLAVSASASSIACVGGTANVTVSATGGTAPYTGTGTFNVAAGTYTYSVTDANGCTASTTISVNEPAAVVASVSASSIACAGGLSDITVSATGGTAPYSGTGVYSVSAGTYSYTVTDANGCSSSVSASVSEPSALSAAATVSELNCSTLSSDLIVSATGGTAPYSGTGTFNVGVGTYNYTVTDANGCSVNVAATVAFESGVDLTCPGDQFFSCSYSQSCGAQTTGAIVSWDEPTATSFSSCDAGCGPVVCIPGFTYMGDFNGTRYYRSSTSNYTWQAANNAANNAGGHLVTIQDAAENQFVKSQIVTSVAWIGYTDQSSEGNFEWVTGENDSYTNWAAYQPDNNGPVPNSCGYCGQSDFVVIRKDNGTWNDRFECNLHAFVMEIPCGNPITITQTSGPANGSYVAGGTTQVVTYVATDDVTGATATCSFTVSVEECTPVYCESEGSCTAYEWINKVTLGSINNQSGNNGGYADFTSMVTTAAPGNSVNLQLTPGFSGAAYQETWRVWVDWNYDGDFYDQSEMVYQGMGASVLNGSFSVPQFASLNKNLRVRVSMRWNCYSSPCSYFQYGEVEDYTIYVQASGPQGMSTTIGQTDKESGIKQNVHIVNTDNVDAKIYDDVADDASIGGLGIVEVGDIYPNPVLTSNGKVSMNVRAGRDMNVTVRIVDLSGKVMMDEQLHLESGLNSDVLNVSGYARGTYILEVQAGDVKESTQLVVQ